MRTTVRIIAVMLAIAAIVTASPACQEPDYMPKPKPSQSAYAYVSPTPAATADAATPTASPTEYIESDPELEGLHYKADGKPYVYLSTDPKQQAFEADIVYLANMFLTEHNGNPKLNNVDCPIADYNLTINPAAVTENYYDAELRMEFLRRINELILSIPEKNDYELDFGLCEIVAMLNDPNVSFGTNEASLKFPFEFLPVFTEDGCECYVTWTLKELEKCLMCRLDAINGVSIDQVIQRMGKLIAHESEEELFYRAVTRGYLKIGDCLRYLGVIDDKYESSVTIGDYTGYGWGPVTFTFTNGEGETFDIEATADTSFMFNYFGTVDFSPKEEVSKHYLGTDFKHSKGVVSPWYEFISDEKTLYIRLNCDISRKISRFLDELMQEVSEATVERVIIDCRSLSGVAYEKAAGIAKRLNEIKAKKYVLIDHTLDASNVILPTFLKRFVDDVELVGSPAFDAPLRGLFATTFNLGQKGNACATSTTRGYNYWPESEYNILTPDMTVYQTAEDYRNGVDSVLKALLN